jgi:hypothetical protein
VQDEIGSAGDPAVARLGVGRVKVVLKKRRRLVLYLFSGPEHSDSLQNQLALLGIDTTMVDKVLRGPNMDVLDDKAWSELKGDIADGVYDAGIITPPCGSYSSSREHQPGPPVLRSVEHILGLPQGSGPNELSAANREIVRAANIITDRAAEAFGLFVGSNLPVLFENPLPIEGKPTIFLVPSVVALGELPGVDCADMDQCEFESLSTKPTRWMAYGIQMAALRGHRCSHQRKWQWAKTLLGRWQSTWSAHPSFIQQKEGGEWLSKKSAAYPANLNLLLADVLCDAIGSSTHHAKGADGRDSD